jgi:cathepsin F
MKINFKLFLLLVLITIYNCQEDDFAKEQKHFKKFMKFTIKHNKAYSSFDEFTERFNVFKTNRNKKLALLVENDRNNSTTNTTNSTDATDDDNDNDDTNQFLDMTPQEFRTTYLNLNIKLTDMIESSKPTSNSWAGSLSLGGKRVLQTAPTAWDWRSKNGVSPVKNQGLCGSCFSFAAIATIESQYLIKYGSVNSLSEQQIVDCDIYDSGCNGGIVANVYYYLMNVHGPISSKDYPYTSGLGTVTGICKASSYLSQVRVTGYKYAGTTDENSIAQWLSSFGPLAAALNADLLQYYTSGILLATNVCDVTGVNHAITLVGYGVSATSGLPYWIIKNSWGSTWGESGYFRLQKGKGLCGINKYVLSATIS